MRSLFADACVAEGYARSRPAVHAVVIDLVRARLSGRVFGRAVDVGCGGGLSTGALEKIARRCVGLEPARQMLRWTAATAPKACFAAGRAEELPFRRGSVDLLTAAGSLNYVADLNAFFGEAGRVLAPTGVLVVYDFTPGRRFPDSAVLDGWFREFMRRYPKAADSARPLSPGRLESLADGFELSWHEKFEVGLEMDSASYERYMMTETNVGYAIRHGVREAGIRAWLHETLPAVFGGVAREVLFEGYVACLAPGAGTSG